MTHLQLILGVYGAIFMIITAYIYKVASDLYFMDIERRNLTSSFNNFRIHVENEISKLKCAKCGCKKNGVKNGDEKTAA